jgi:hypothetical protein
MAIVRLALANPAANTNTLLHTAERQSIVSVIATNMSASAESAVQVWIQPSGSSSASQYAYITYNVPIPIKNTLETFRFALEDGDELYVRSSTANVSFSLNGIYESVGNQYVSVSATAPSSPTIGDVWIDTDDSTVNFWTGTVWESAVGAAAIYQNNAPSTPSIGDIWVDADEQVVAINSNDYMLKSGGTFTGTISGELFSPNLLSAYTISASTSVSASTGSFTGVVSAATPVNSNDLTTKLYVDDRSDAAAIPPSFFLGGM